MPLTKSQLFEKNFPKMDISAVDIDNQVGCAQTGRRCLAVTGEVQIVFDPASNQAIGLRSSITNSCSTCIHTEI